MVTIFFPLCLMFFFTSSQAMDDWFGKDDTETDPLLQLDPESNMHDEEGDPQDEIISTQQDQFPLLDLNKEHPALVAKVFSFVPSSSPELNYLIRFFLKTPSEDPIQTSPFYTIVKGINEAHEQHIVDKYKKNLDWYKDNSTLYDAQKKLIIAQIFSFMKTTKDDKKNQPKWTDIQILDVLLPKNAHVLEFDEINKVLSDYCDQTQQKLNKIRYVDTDKENKENEECVKNAEAYLRMRTDVFDIFRKRIGNYPGYSQKYYVMENNKAVLSKPHLKNWYSSMGVLTVGSLALTIATGFAYLGDPVEAVSWIPKTCAASFVGSLIYDGVVYCIIKKHPTCVKKEREQIDCVSIINLFNESYDTLRNMQPLEPSEQV
jgi:hypothetical protein